MRSSATRHRAPADRRPAAIRHSVIVAAPAALLLLPPVAPASADHTVTHTRQQVCAAAGGTFSGSNASNPTNNQLDNQRCTITTTVVGPAVPSGTPRTTDGPATPFGEPTPAWTRRPFPTANRPPPRRS